jgi:AcrR family transcriptional regulator
MEHAGGNADERIRSASRARRERQRDELRTQIVETAASLLSDGGAEAVTMRAIAERIGYSPTTIYHHFDDRDALMATVLDRAFGVFRAALGDALAAHEQPAARIRAMGQAYVDFALAHPREYQLMLVQRPDYLVRLGPEEGASFSESLGALTELVGNSPAGRSGRVTPHAGANALWGAMHGIAALSTGFAALDDAQGRAAAEAALETMIAGLWTAGDNGG